MRLLQLITTTTVMISSSYLLVHWSVLHVSSLRWGQSSRTKQSQFRTDHCHDNKHTSLTTDALFLLSAVEMEK